MSVLASRQIITAGRFCLMRTDRFEEAVVRLSRGA